MQNTDEEDIIKAVNYGTIHNFGYTLYQIDKYSNECKYEYKIVSSTDGTALMPLQQKML